MTQTSSDGVSKRESHDASSYYARGIGKPVVISTDTRIAQVPDEAVNKLFSASSEQMRHLPDACVPLAFTSPPYHVGKVYDADGSWDDYLLLLRSVFQECWRVLEPGGRLVVNVANLGRKPYVPLSHIVAETLSDLGFLARAEIIWIKGQGASGNCAWGSWLSPKNPSIRDLHEYILVFSKGRWDKVSEGRSGITATEFMESTLSVWFIPPASAKRIGHPAPFPVDLAKRVINLYSHVGDVVLDPFMGSGTTAIAALELGRRWVGYENHQPYVDLAEARIAAHETPAAFTTAPHLPEKGDE